MLTILKNKKANKNRENWGKAIQHASITRRQSGFCIRKKESRKKITGKANDGEPKELFDTRNFSKVKNCNGRQHQTSDKHP